MLQGLQGIEGARIFVSLMPMYIDVRVLAHIILDQVNRYCTLSLLRQGRECRQSPASSAVPAQAEPAGSDHALQPADGWHPAQAPASLMGPPGGARTDPSQLPAAEVGAVSAATQEPLGLPPSRDSFVALTAADLDDRGPAGLQDCQPACKRQAVPACVPWAASPGFQQGCSQPGVRLAAAPLPREQLPSPAHQDAGCEVAGVCPGLLPELPPRLTSPSLPWPLPLGRAGEDFSLGLLPGKRPRPQSCWLGTEHIHPLPPSLLMPALASTDLTPLPGPPPAPAGMLPAIERISDCRVNELVSHIRQDDPLLCVPVQPVFPRLAPEFGMPQPCLLSPDIGSMAGIPADALLPLTEPRFAPLFSELLSWQ